MLLDVVFLLCLPLYSLAAGLSGVLTPAAGIPDLYETRVLLNGGQLSSLVDEQGNFYFPEVPVGSHVLEVLSNTFAYDRLKVDAGKDGFVKASHAYPGLSWARDGPNVILPLRLTPRVQYEYITPPAGFNVWGLFTNPMILMSVVPLLLLFLMPKLTEGMDEETLKELRSNRQQVSNNVEMPDVSQKLADWFAPKAVTDTAQSPGRSGAASKKKK